MGLNGLGVLKRISGTWWVAYVEGDSTRRARLHDVVERDGHPVAEQPRRLAEAGVRYEQRQHHGRGLLRALLLQCLREQLRGQDGVEVSLLARLADGILARGPALLLLAAAPTLDAAAAHLVCTALAAPCGS